MCSTCMISEKTKCEKRTWSKETSRSVEDPRTKRPCKWIESLVARRSKKEMRV